MRQLRMHRRTRIAPPPQKSHVYKIPLYGGRVYLYLNREEMNRVVERYDLDTVDECMGVTIGANTTDGPVFLVGVFEGGRQTLVHELNHVTLNVCEWVGIDPLDSGGEPVCYLLDSIFGHFDHLFDAKPEPKKEMEVGA